MKHKNIRNIIIIAVVTFCFMVLTDQYGIVVAMLVSFPVGFITGMVSARVDRWVGD